MLSELRAKNLGVIEDLRLSFEQGMTAVTGETGAGKTLIVTAMSLLVGGKAEARMVRSGADEATVEGRFVDMLGQECVLRRIISAAGRSRCYVDGDMVALGSLSERGAELVDIHGQHGHQQLLRVNMQRNALDAFSSIDLDPLLKSRRRLHDIDARIAELGGDLRTRARELDMVTYQLDELARAELSDADEDLRLQSEEEVLGDAEQLRLALAGAHEDLEGDGGALDRLRQGLAKLANTDHLASCASRLRALIAEADDLGAELIKSMDTISQDPERLAAVQRRRAVLSELRRKYGPTLSDVVAFRDESQRRHDSLVATDTAVDCLEDERATVLVEQRKLEAKVGAARRSAAKALGAAVQARLSDLALGGARFEVHVGETDPGDEVSLMFQANLGSPLAPLSAVASGGELARTMLALRLVLGEAGGEAETAVFDEADAGIGGQAAVAVGHALATLARRRQVLVVTHLPQVAAFASTQVVVDKRTEAGATIALADIVTDDKRVIELSRMLSGMPESEAGHRHAEELLADARSMVAQ